MKKLLGLFAALVFSASTFAVELQENVHYQIIDKKSQGTAKPEIKEFFSYYCPHCKTFEPLAKKLKDRADTEGYKFVKSHVDFLRGASTEIQMMLTKALITSEKLNVPQVNDAIFNYIQTQRAAITGEKDIRNLFLINGVDGKKFDKVFNSFAVVAAAKKMKKEQDNLASKRILTGVPTFIVNGKYKLINNGFDAKSYGDLFTKLEEAAIELSKKK